MQSIMFLKSTDDGPIDRIINLDLLVTAYPVPEEEGGVGTIAIVGGTRISMGLPFAEFLAKVEWLIAENYRVSNESSLAWHNKRQKDQEEMLKSVLGEFHK